MIISEIYKTVNFGDVEIVEYIDSRNVVVRFKDTGSIATFSAGNIRKGKVKDRFYPIVCGFGYIGNGESRKDGLPKKSYSTWRHMIERCYKSSGDRFRSYIACSVCDEWRSFEAFEKWFNLNYIDGHELDKDILIDGNKIYSPETCMFVSKPDNVIKASAKSYRFKSPCGIIIDIYNLDKFCRENKLHPPAMRDVNSGRKKSHKGWAVATL